MAKTSFNTSTTTRTPADWTVITFGLLDVVTAISGLLNPNRLRTSTGLPETGDPRSDNATRTLLLTISIAAINNGTAYILGGIHSWRGFAAWSVAARLFMGTGFIIMTRQQLAPKRFRRAVIWELVGAASTTAAIWSKRHTSAIRP
ncbi:MAG: hypothetical protein ACRDUX_11930 [Mycobacterium sp.]